jgi:DNA-binding response OmpR family regulator
MVPLKSSMRQNTAQQRPQGNPESESGSTWRPAIKRILVVDGDSRASKCVSDAATARGDCDMVLVRTVEEARRVLENEPVNFMVTEMHLSDGEGLSLVSELRRSSPGAGFLVTAKAAKVDDAVAALRQGAADFVPKPFTREVISDRLGKALTKQHELNRHERKLARLRDAVRKLSEARRMVAKKVDLLCNDLVTAYGEVSRQVDAVRTQEDFRKICDGAADLEQLLCHAMDWIMRRVGYANIAVFLASDEMSGGAADGSGGGFQLGAYVKYTIPSSTELTESLRNGMVMRAGREGFVRLSADEAVRELSPAELRHLRGQAIVAANCTYLGESLSTVVLFRDGASPFTNEDAETFKAIAPIFAIALASQVRSPITEDPDANPSATNEPGEDSEGKPNRDDRSDADWWKRGEAPPF